jgi:DNA-directed RNA polymerase II subunit RPB2
MSFTEISSLTKTRETQFSDEKRRAKDTRTYTLLDEKIEEPKEFSGNEVRQYVWKLFDNYFSDPNRLTQHHTLTFDKFISQDIPKIIHDHNPIEVKSNYSPLAGRYLVKYVIEFGDIYIGKPGIKDINGTTKMMYPIEARWRNLTYSADMFSDIYQKVITYDEKGNETVKEFPPLKMVNLTSMPIMLKSKYGVLSSQVGKSMGDLGECEYDKGGYFIVKGAEKVLVCQERKCENKLLAFSQNKTQSSYSNTVEISSVPQTQSFNRSTQMKLLKKTSQGTIQVFIQRFKSDSPFPLFIVFRALGVTSDKDIVERILYDYKAKRNRDSFDLLRASLEEASSVRTQDMALLFMANYVSKMPEMKETNETNERFRMRHVATLLETELFPHVGKDPLKKAWFLGMMAKKLIDTALGIKKYDDRDSFINKRVSTAGSLMADLFRNNFNKLVREITKAVDSDLRQGRIDEVHTSILKKIKASTIGSGSSIRYALGTGTWGMKSQASTAKKGIAQPINRLSYSSYISHMRRVNAPRAEKGGKITEPRKLHSTQWMRFDPFETPDGHMIGIVKNMSLQTMITIGTDDDTVISVLKEENVTPILEASPKQMAKEVRIIIDGNPYGCTNDPNRIVAKLRELRRSGSINVHTSITWLIKDQEILIYVGPGRLVRPVFVVKNNNILATKDDFKKIARKEKGWQDMILEGKIEYLDPQEEDTAMIAMLYEDLVNNKTSEASYIHYTHAEIHPAMMFGAVACAIPFVVNNQGPRVSFECAQRKQALAGGYTSNYRDRMDNPGQVLRFPQIPLVSTKMAKYVHERDLPSGQNAIVAIACFKGLTVVALVIVKAMVSPLCGGRCFQIAGNS